MYEIELRSNPERKPIKVDSVEQAIVYSEMVLSMFNRKLFITYPLCDDSYEYVELDEKDVAYTKSYTHEELEQPIQAYGKSIKVSMVDIYILGLDLGMIEATLDYAVLFKPILETNEKMVEQYKSGNDKALNALLGKFLKDNRGTDPKEVKEELIKLLSK